MERKLHYSLDFFIFRTLGGIYRYQENGGQGDNLWPETLAQPRPVWLRKRGCTGTARVALPTTRCRVSPLSAAGSVF